MASERSQELSFQSLATKHIDLKQVELDTAVAKVDELSRQLDSLWTDSPGQAAEPPKVDRYSASPMHAPVPLRMATSPQLQHARRSVSLEPTDGYITYRAETLPAGSQPPKASLGRPASPQSPFYLAGELSERAQSPRPKVDRYSASPMHAPVPLRMATSPQLQHARRSVSLEPTDGYVNYRAETLPAGSQPPKASLGRPASPQSPFYLAGELPERAQSPRPKVLPVSLPLPSPKGRAPSPRPLWPAGTPEHLSARPVDRYSASPMHAPVPLRMATSPQLQHARRSVSLEPTDGYITYRAETLPAGSQPPKASLGRPASPQSPFYLAGELPERAQSPRPKVLPVSLPLPSPKGRAPSPRPLWPAGAPEHLSARPVGRAGSPRLAPAPSEGPAPQMFFPERAPSPRPAAYESHSAFPAGPSSFAPFRTQDDLVIRRRAQRSWNESDLDVAYEKKSSHSAAFERGDVPLGPRPVPAGLQLALWRESSLDGAAGKGKDDPSQLYAVHSATLPRNYKASPLAGERQDSSFRRLLPPSQTGTLPRSWQFSQQPVSRIAMPPPSLPGLRAKPHKPLPLSMIFKLQNAFWASGASGAKSQLQGPPGSPLFLRSLQKPQPLPPSPAAQAPPRLAPSGGEVTGRAPAPEALAEPGRGAPAGGDAEPELESILRGGEPAEAEEVPRPLSPTRLQPVLPPEAQKVPEFEEVARVLAEIPRPLKRRGSMEQSPGPALPPTHKKQYQQLISRLFHHRSRKEEALPPADAPADMTPIPEAAELKEGASLSPAPAPASQSPSVPAATPLLAVTETPPGPRPRTPSPETRSVLRKLSSPRRAGRRVRLNPLVLLLDGALTGELDVVQQAVSELHDSSQPNDEGITALHNAICGANYNIVDFLIAVGANVNSPDSHGWTPLHCAASCNDTVICMALIRHGAAIFTTTFSDGSTALEKCDPYREGYTECSSYLADVEQNTGRLNSGVVYALWDYAAEFGDELSFREGEPVTVLRRDGPEELGWWWASLYGQEGYVPRNYFGLFPRVKPQQQQKV